MIMSMMYCVFPWIQQTDVCFEQKKHFINVSPFLYQTMFHVNICCLFFKIKFFNRMWRFCKLLFCDDAFAFTFRPHCATICFSS